MAITWTEQRSAVKFFPFELLYAEVSIGDALALARLRGQSVIAIIPVSVRRAVMAHLETTQSELGGLLVGEAFSEDGVRVVAVRVTAAIASHDYSSTGISLRMESDVWSRAHAALGPGRLIVGWYHSHPGLSAFFSVTDRRTQQAFFPHQYSLGWVIDPTDGDERIFVGASSIELAADHVLTDSMR